MKLPTHVLASFLLTALPLTAGAQGKPKRSAVPEGILVTPQKPAPRIARIATGTKTSRTLVSAKAKKTGKDNTRHLLNIYDYRPDEHIRDDLSFFEVHRDGVVWDEAARGKLTPQRVRQAMRGKAIAADLIEENLSEFDSEVRRDRTYVLDAVLAEQQPVDDYSHSRWHQRATAWRIVYHHQQADSNDGRQRVRP